MTTSYPGGLDAFTNPAGTDSLDTPTVLHHEQHANLNDAVEAIEAELGTNPSGTEATVGARIAAVEAEATAQAVDLADVEAAATDRLGALEAAGAAPDGVTAARTTTSAVSSFVAMPENIVKVGTTYWLLYSVATGTKTSLYLASSTSPDGPWTASGEVLTVGSLGWETAPHTNGGALVHHGSTFYLFYSVDATSGAIGVATASTVTGPYTKNATPLLQVAASGWDSLRVQEPSVWVAPDGTWVMAYMGEDAAYAKGTTEKVGIATATDPLGPWTKADANPVIGFGAAGQWDEGGAADPSLFYEGGVWWCLYSGLSAGGAMPWRLGLAYAYDPAGPWTRHLSNPILGPGAGGAFDANSVWRGAIYEEGGTYYLPYGGIPASGDAADAKVGSARVSGLGGVAPHRHAVADIDATGTADATTYLRGDGVWATPAGGSGSRVEVVMQDGVSSPPVPLETEDGTDWLYTD